jgi:hypothetical protein
MAVHSMILRTPPIAGVTLTNNITAGASSLTYTGPDSIATGDLIVIDNEIMGVGAVNAGANTANLFRGRLGTTAAAHSANAPIRTLDNLSVLQMVSDGEEQQAGQDIIDIWAPAGTLQQAATESNRYMINAWTKKTKSDLVLRAAEDSLAEHHADQAAAQGTYDDRFPGQ